MLWWKKVSFLGLEDWFLVSVQHTFGNTFRDSICDMHFLFDKLTLMRPKNSAGGLPFQTFQLGISHRLMRPGIGYILQSVTVAPQPSRLREMITYILIDPPPLPLVSPPFSYPSYLVLPLLNPLPLSCGWDGSRWWTTHFIARS